MLWGIDMAVWFNFLNTLAFILTCLSSYCCYFVYNDLFVLDAHFMIIVISLSFMSLLHPLSILRAIQSRKRRASLDGRLFTQQFEKRQ